MSDGYHFWKHWAIVFLGWLVGMILQLIPIWYFHLGTTGGFISGAIGGFVGITVGFLIADTKYPV